MRLLKKEVVIVQKMEIKAILFDLDGVLVDSVDAWFHVFNDINKLMHISTLLK